MNVKQIEFRWVTFGALIAALNLFPTTSSAKDALTGIELARELNHTFIEVAEKVSPAVVVVNVTQKAETFKVNEDGEDTPESLPDDLRKYFRRRMHGPAEPPEKNYGQGSGVIIREDGYILTNRHVVEDAEEIEVRLKDGRQFKAEVRGADAQSDIAVIKIKAKGLPFARLADSSKTRVGEFAIAIGAPFELDYSVTFGHVSAKGRRVLADQIMMDQDFIQTDAASTPATAAVR